MLLHHFRRVLVHAVLRVESSLQESPPRARLRQQLLGEVGIIGPAFRQIGVEEGARLRDGQMRQRRAAAEEGALHDLLAADGMGTALRTFGSLKGGREPLKIST